MPAVAGSRASAPNPFYLRLTEFQTPLSIRFITDHNPALGHHLLHIAVAQREAEIQPNTTMTNDLRRKAMAVVKGSVHDPLDRPELNFTIPYRCRKISYFVKPVNPATKKEASTHPMILWK